MLSKAGDQVPETPFAEVVGNGFKIPPLQIGVTAAKLGVKIGFTIIIKV